MAVPGKRVIEDKAITKPQDELVELASVNSNRGDKEILQTAPTADYSGASKKTDPDEIRLVRKLDLYILPILWAMYYLNWIDRNALPQARLNGIEEDLNLKGVQWNTAISILQVGYVLMQIPSNMILTRTRPSIYMPVCMMGWAVVSACTALVKGFGGLVACRFFLGFVEAPYYPGVLYLLSIFYTRKELASRIAVMYTGQIVANGTAGLIAAAVFSTMDGAHGIRGWQWLFIIEGVTTFGVAAMALYLMPDEPGNTRWLTPRERELAVKRIERDIVGLASRGSTWDGLRQAVQDPKTWLFVLMQNLHISACSFTFFFPTIVRAMGFSNTKALLLTAPPYFVAGIFGIVIAWTSGHFNERTWHITASLLLAIIGFVITVSTLDTAARYVASIIFATGAFGAGSVILGWLSATLSQTPEKKAVAYSMVNVAATIAYIYTAYLWPEGDGPRYLPGFIAMACFAGGSLLCAWAMRVWLMALNRKMKTEENETKVAYAY